MIKQQLTDTEISAAPYAFGAHFKTADFHFHYHLYGYFKCPFQTIRNRLRVPADFQENMYGSQMIKFVAGVEVFLQETKFEMFKN